MVLFYEVVKVVHLSNHDLAFTSRIDLINGRLVRAALVHLDLFGNAVGPHGFFKEPQLYGLATPSGQ